jgi:hypothetical protein
MNSSTEQSPSWQANSRWVGEQILPPFVQHKKVHNPFHRHPHKHLQSYIITAFRYSKTNCGHVMSLVLILHVAVPVQTNRLVRHKDCVMPVIIVRAPKLTAALRQLCINQWRSEVTPAPYRAPPLLTGIG